jgi:hypothetical protein
VVTVEVSHGQTGWGVRVHDGNRLAFAKAPVAPAQQRLDDLVPEISNGQIQISVVVKIRRDHGNRQSGRWIIHRRLELPRQSGLRQDRESSQGKQPRIA